MADLIRIKQIESGSELQSAANLGADFQQAVNDAVAIAATAFATTGSNSFSGSQDISGSITADLQKGYIWVGDSTNRNIIFPTASLVTNVNTGSLATTGSNTFQGTQTFSGSIYHSGSLFATASNAIYATTASYVDDLQFLNSLSTGIISGGIVTINSGDATKIDITSGSGYIIDGTYDAANPQRYYVTWPDYVGVTVTNLPTSTTSHIAIDKDGNVVQYAEAETNQQRREVIMLVSLGHSDNTTVKSVNPGYSVLQSPIEQYRDLVAEFRLINDGNAIYPNGNNLLINKDSGSLFGQGLNYTNNPKDPHKISTAAKLPATVRYRTQSGGTTGAVSNIDATNYDVVGVVTALPGGPNTATNQYVFLFPNNNIVIQYGQYVYATKAAALQGLTTENFIKYVNVAQEAILIGIISVIKGATDLSDSSQATFIPVSDFGDKLSGAGGVSVTSLAQAYANSTTPEITTNDILGGVTIKDGTTFQNSSLLELSDKNDNITISMYASGGISARSLDVSQSLTVGTNFTASLQKGYIWVGDSNNRSTTFATASLSGGGGSSGTAGSSGTSGVTGASGSSGTAGSSGSSGSSGTAGSSGTSGQTGASGSSGTSGQTGASGSSGTSGSTGSSGTSGLNGSSGTSGQTGASGSSGTSGQTGSSGTSGANGSSGSSGTSGQTGSSGTSGQSGTAGSSGTSGQSGTAGSSGTSGQSGTAGSSGTSGANGSSGTAGASGDRFASTSTDTETIAASGLIDFTIESGLQWTPGQQMLFASGSTDYMILLVNSYNGGTGVVSASIDSNVGSGTYSQWYINTVGAAGQAGSSGSSGTSGQTGSSGTSGANGSSGTSGANGSSGTSGQSGTAGSSGTSGQTGSSGTSGSTGSSGTSGANGSSGSSGTSGSTGSSGTSGSSGSSGTRGSSGSSGTRGSSGTSGANGSSGSSGTSGQTGSSGTSGQTGSSGSSGTSGQTGSSGTSGANGSSGSSGTSGANGSSGTSGATGAGGSSGTSGAGASITSPADNRILTSDGTVGGIVAEASMSFTQDNGGSLTVTGSFTASLQSGYVWVGDTNNITVAASTSSFGGGGASVTSPGDNRIVTSDGTAGGLVGEASMSFTQDGGGQLVVTGTFNVSQSLTTGTNFTASIQEGYTWVGDANNVTTLVATSSFGGGSGTSGSSGTSGQNGSSGTSGQNGSSGTSGQNGSSGTSGVNGSSGTSGQSGTAGSSGTSGANGSSGSSGTSGANGSSGSSGTSGANGSSGSSGTSGANGSSGSSGTSGANGSSGSSGTSGQSGTAGSSGTSGQSGTAGSSGTSGQSGTAGSSGTSGANGSSGSSGTSGQSGTAGSSGTSGQTGSSGTSGADGSSGSSGTSGQNGSSGTSGANGSSGSSGTSGQSGTAGSSGTSGQSGTAGSSGTSGANGSSGSSGTSGANGSSGTSGQNGSSGTSGANGSSGSSGTSGQSGTAGSSGTSGQTGSSGTSGADGAGVSVTNTGDNRVITSDGTTTGLIAESNFSFSGTNLIVTGSAIVSGSLGGGVFSKGVTLADLTNGISNSGSYVIWRAPFPAAVQRVWGLRVNGGPAQVNAFRSSSAGFDPHLASNITISASGDWQQNATAVQNTAYSIGNTLFVHISGSAANSQVAIQVDYVKTL